MKPETCRLTPTQERRARAMLEPPVRDTRGMRIQFFLLGVAAGIAGLVLGLACGGWRP